MLLFLSTTEGYRLRNKEEQGEGEGEGEGRWSDPSSHFRAEMTVGCLASQPGTPQPTNPPGSVLHIGWLGVWWFTWCSSCFSWARRS